MEIIFQLSSLLVMPFWLMIIFLPHWQWTRRIMASPWVVAPAALLYALLVIPSLLFKEIWNQKGNVDEHGCLGT